MKDKRMDPVFLFVVAALVLGGFFIFISASMGLLAREGARFSTVAGKQLLFGIVLGGAALFLFSRIHYRFWKKYAVWFLGGALILTALVFVPFIGFEHGGARRWIHIGSFATFQPAEILKLAVVVYLSAWFAAIKNKVHTIKWGVLPLLGVLALAGLVLLLQPDTGTFLVIVGTAMALFLIAGGRIKHLALMAGGLVLALGLFALSKPYILERLYTFIDPSRDPSGASWQLQQSLIAIGTGGVFGKGFGQSVQKFDFLPEPVSDSIFAVAAEEFGFVGASILIALFVLFLWRGLIISRRAPDTFSGLLVAGIVIMIVLQSFVNIGSMLGIFPLTGLPLLFVSHGATALLVTLAAVGIVLNVSRYKR